MVRQEIEKCDWRNPSGTNEFSGASASAERRCRQAGLSRPRGGRVRAQRSGRWVRHRRSRPGYPGLAAARERFGSDGYERTTLRAIAGDVGVDPALAIRYFGSKQQLFAAAAEFTLHLPDLTGRRPDDMADARLERFFAVWEADTTFVALLRAAMTSSEAAATMRQVFATQVAPIIAAVAPDHPGPRAALIGSLVLGMATTRYVLEAPAAKAMDHDELIRWARPVIRDLLVGPAPR